MPVKDDDPGHVAPSQDKGFKDQKHCDTADHDASTRLADLVKRQKILQAIVSRAGPRRNMKLETRPLVVEQTMNQEKNNGHLAVSLVAKTTDPNPSKKKGGGGLTAKNNDDDPNESNSFGSNEKTDKANSDKARMENGSYVCPLCDEVMSTSHDFTIHIRQHNPNDHSHTCRLCGKTLSSASSLDRHMLVHSGERPFKCKLCAMAFTTNGNMHRHMRTHGEEAEQLKIQTKEAAAAAKNKHSNKRKSDANSANGTKRLELEGGLKSVKGEDDAQPEVPHRCPICDKSFLSKYIFEEHMELHPNDPIYCKECNGTFSIYSAYRDHHCKGPLVNGMGHPGLLHHPFSSGNNSVGFTDLSFVDFSSSKFSLIAKSVCESSARRPSSAFHAFECEKCDKSFPCASALRLHGVTHSDPRGTYCATCECDFLTPQGLQTHQLKHRMTEQCGEMTSLKRPPVVQEEGEDLSKKGVVPEARKEDFLAVLQLKNNDSRKIPKIKIKKDRTKENNFENVSYFVHGKPEAPRYCNKEGAESSDFADIQSIISVTSKSPFTTGGGNGAGMGSSPIVAAPASPLTVTSSACVSPESPLAADSANASPETPSKEDSEHSSLKGQSDEGADTDGAIVEGIYTCKTCNVSFKKVSELKRHNRKHSQICNAYSCSMCKYNSTDKSTLIRHLRTHNGERPFQCVICKYAFTTKANCERHVRKRHKKLNKAEVRSAMQYNPNMGETTAESLPPEINGSETVCKYCNVDFKSNRVLRHHLRSLHNSCRRKPFYCTLCKLGFSTKNNCIRHVAKQHPDMKEKLRDIVISNNSQSDCSDMESGLLSDESPSKWDSSQTADSNHNWEYGSLNENTTTTTTITPVQQQSFDLTVRTVPTDLSKTAGKDNSLPAPLPLPAPSTRPPPTITTEEQPLNLTVSALCLSANPAGCSGSRSTLTEDMVSAANSLVSLSEALPPQEEPLDLAVHALDLTVKTPQTKALALTVPKTPKPINLYNVRRLPICPPRAPPTVALRLPYSPIQSLTTAAPVSLLVRNQNPIVIPTPPTLMASNVTPRDVIPVPVSQVANHRHNENQPYRTFKLVNDRLSPRNQRSFSCVYCSAGFTLKSNMERHIKRKHPEFARPTRSRNFIPTLSPNISKNTVQTLSNKTRDALKMVLTSKASVASPACKDENGGTTPNTPDSKHLEESLNSECSNAEMSVLSVSSLGKVAGESDKEEFADDDHEEGDLVIECSDSNSPAKKDKKSEVEVGGAPSDLASVSSVIDTANSQQFQRYLKSGERREDAKSEEEMDEDEDEDAEDEEDEDEFGEVPLGKENQEGGEQGHLESSDNQSSPSHSGGSPSKKRSSYMDSPNSVACPFCSRKFPWTSSLRRHILTHTGQKPFKCPRCPIWFTTKSNCERHLVRKHGQNSEVLSRTVPDRPYKCTYCPSSTFSTQGNLRKHYYLKHWTKTGSASTGTVIGARNRNPPSEPERFVDVLEGVDASDSAEEGALPGSPDKAGSDHNDQPFRCHLCRDAFFDLRKDCLSHMESEHPEEFKLLTGKSSPRSESGVPDSDSVETETNNNVEKVEEGDDGRKVKCAFCSRKFWSGEDLRRHVRTHSGDTNYTCDVCDRDFSSKHGMIRHRRKHSGKSSSAMTQDSSDDECAAPPPKVDFNVPSSRPKKPKTPKQKQRKQSQNSLLYLMPRNENHEGEKTNSAGASDNNNSTSVNQNKTTTSKKEEAMDLIQNLLGIQDSSMIDQMLDSADSAARILGVQEV